MATATVAAVGEDGGTAGGRQWLLDRSFSEVSIGRIERKLLASGHACSVATLERLGEDKLRAAVWDDDSGKATPAGANRDRRAQRRVPPRLQQRSSTPPRGRGQAPQRIDKQGENPAGTAYQWLLSQGLDQDQIQHVKDALKRSGHAFDMQKVKRLGIDRIRDAVPAQHSPRTRQSSLGFERHASPSERADIADPHHEYSCLRRERMALLVAQHNHARVPGSQNIAAKLQAKQVVHNCPQGLDEYIGEIKTLCGKSLLKRFHEVERSISEWQIQSARSQLVGHGGITIGTGGGARIEILEFDIADFSTASATEAFVPETTAVILDNDDSSTGDSAALFAEMDSQTLVGKIVVIDMHARCDNQGNTPQWGLFPCEYAFAAQQAGACGVLFVYPPDTSLRGAMRSLHRKDDERAAWIPCVAITVSSTRGLLFRKDGTLWFDPTANGKATETTLSCNDEEHDSKDHLLLRKALQSAKYDDKQLCFGEENQDDKETHAPKDVRRSQKMFRVSFQYDVKHVRTQAKNRFKRAEYAECLGPAISTVEIGDYVQLDRRQEHHDDVKSLFLRDDNAMVTAVFVDRFPAAGVYTVMVENGDGMSTGVALNDIVVNELNDELERVLRYGTEKMILTYLKENSIRSKTTGKKKSLWRLFSNPSITLDAVKEVHSTIWEKQKIAVHDMKSDETKGFTPLHYLCGNIHASVSIVRYVLTEICVNPDAALRAQPDQLEHDELIDSNCFPAPSPLHIACRGLPLNIDMLKLILNAKGMDRWDAHAAALPVDMRNTTSMEEIFSKDAITGQQPLHTVTQWPHIRISPKGIKALFDACPAVAKMLILDEPPGWSPLHRICDLLHYHRTTQKVSDGSLSRLNRSSTELSRTQAVGRSVLEQIAKQADDTLAQIFEEIDDDDSQEMSVDEWAGFLDAAGCTVEDELTHNQRPPDDQERDAAWSLIDLNSDRTVSFDEFFSAVEHVRKAQQTAAKAAAQIHLAYIQDRTGDMMKVALAMVHQWRGTWSKSQTDALENAGIIGMLSHWIQDLWVPAPRSDPLATGTFVSVATTTGMKARVIRDYRPAKQQVELQEYTIGANIMHADFEAATRTVNTVQDLLLRCPLCEFLCESSNAFECMFNLIEYYSMAMKRNRTESQASRQVYQRILLALSKQVGRLASWMPLRCIDNDSYLLSKVLLQPGMLPTFISNRHDCKWQLTGGIANRKGSNLSSKGPLEFAVKQHVAAFTSSEWVRSYVERAQFDSVPPAKYDYKGAGMDFQFNSFYTTLYEGWDIPMVQCTVHEKLARGRVVDIDFSVSLLALAVCGIVNPRATFTAPRMLWCLDLLFKLIFAVVFTWVWTINKGEDRPSKHREIDDCINREKWFGTTQLFESNCWTLKRDLSSYRLWDFYIVLTAAGMAEEFLRSGVNSEEIWSKVDFLSSVMILAGAGLMMLDVTAEIGYSLNCAVGLLLWLRMLYYLQDSESIGPLVSVVGEMTVITLRFFALIVIFVLGFAFSMTALLQNPYANESTHAQVIGPYTDLIQGAWTLFKALLGDMDGVEFYGENREPMATAVMAIYLVVMSIILLNMLIAVLSSSHAKVEASLEQEVAHVQTSVAINSQHKSNNAWLPAPMNLLQILAPNNQHRKEFWDFVIVLVGVPVMIIIAVAMWTPLGPYIATKQFVGKRDIDFGAQKKPIGLNILGLWLCGTCPLIAWALCMWAYSLLIAFLALLRQTLCPHDGKESVSQGSSEQLDLTTARDRRRPWTGGGGNDSETSEEIKVEMSEVKEWIKNEAVAAGGVQWEGAILGALVGDDDRATSGIVIALDQVKRDLLELHEQMKKQQQQLDGLTAGALRSGE